MEKKKLNLPAHLLEKLTGINDQQWRETHNFNGKRKSRKESRKENRLVKKQKRSHQYQPADNGVKNNLKKKDSKPKKKKKDKGVEKPKLKSDRVLRPFADAHAEELKRKDEEDANYYAKKLGLKSLKLKDNEGDGLDDILGDLDFDKMSDPEADSDIDAIDETDGELEYSDDSDSADIGNVYSDESDNEMTAEETMKRLAALKGKPSTESIRVVKEDDLSEDDLSEDDLSEDELSQDNDSEEMTAEETMRKLAALKGKPSSEKIRVVKEDELSDENDSQSELESLSDSDSEEMTADETWKKLAELKKNKQNSGPLKVVKEDELDDEVSDFSDEFSDSDSEEMTAEETMKRLAALKKAKQGNNSKHDSEDEDEGDSDSDSDSEDEDENPYVPPKRKEAAVSAPKKLVDSESVLKIRRAFKSSLNKLTESTLPHISHEINLVFMKNSISEATEIFTEELINLVGGPQPLQATLYTVYAGLIASLYQSVGITFAASFIQTVVETIVKNGNSNLLSLLVECYAFQVVSSRLMYDLLNHLLGETTVESVEKVELILIIVRNGGSQLRTDDPVGLKSTIIILQKRMQELGGDNSMTARMRFLVDAVVALKNNRQKPVSEIVVSLRHRIRKALQSRGDRKEPMQVGLSDILESETRGKWWLVGASWKGNSERNSRPDADSDKIDIDMDEFGASAVDWLELAKKQRLNTDIRRAVFVALMGAEDYLDACLRIDNLGLKNKQERDIPHVILHCLAQEPAYNPFYAFVAAKQCARHSTLKTFQFRLWDWFATDPSGSPQLALHYGRFYANLVCQSAMPLDVLKQADFLGASPDTRIFLEMFFTTLYKSTARTAELAAKKNSSGGLSSISGSGIERDGTELARLLKRIHDPKVLRGIKIINQTINSSETLRNEKERERVRWASEFTSDLIDELVKIHKD